MQRRGRSGQSEKGRRTTRPKAHKAPIGHASLASLRDKLDQVTRELGEACQRETATSEVLKVISSSPGELEPVFSAMLANATRICEAKIGVLYLHDGDGLRFAATHGAPPAYVEARKQRGVAPDGPVRRAATTKQVVHIADIRELQSYRDRHSSTVVSAELGKFRTVLGVPMLRDHELIGVITLNRQEVRPFTDKQIELVKNFAAQAVIAIENTRLLNELRELLQQQTATSEVLQVISKSPGELEPVFEAMLENAVRICGAKFGTLFRYDGDIVDLAAQFGTPPALTEFQRKRGRFRAETRGTGILGRVIRTKAVVHSADSAADPNPGVATTLGGARSIVGVPMFKDDVLVGAIVIYRQEVRPFTDKQIELVKNFAAQAVIAIENTRLLNELRQRTDDLTELLEQQTATSEVLKVISSSPGELTPVFELMLENAVRICEASFGNLLLYENDAFRHVALYNAPQAWAVEQQRDPIAPRRTAYFLYRVADTKQVTHIADVALENPDEPIAKVAGARTLLIVPMLKENDLIGVIAIYRQEVRPFTDKQIELVKNFAAQAVIAIENTRLLNELRQRTDDLTELLEQQTATSDVLKVISSSPGELEPVFSALLESATRICGAKFGTLYLYEGGVFYATTFHNAPLAFIDARKNRPLHPSPVSMLGRAERTKQAAQILDITKGEAYRHGDPFVVAGAELGGYRTAVAVPMLKEDELVGAISIYRQEVQPFTDKQIELVKNFAAQAVIAIENTRLLSELRELLQQQTATADVLKVISRSTFDLQTVLNTLVELAARLCEADTVSIYQLKDDAYQQMASRGFSDAYRQFMMLHPLAKDRGTLVGRTMIEGRTVQIEDALADPELKNQNRESQKIGQFRTMLGVPLMREGISIGVLTLTRLTVRPFTSRQIELVEAFADQAVIAIENTRLLSELRQSLDQQTATADVLKVISRSTFDLQTVLQTLVESAARLCNADKGTITRQKDGPFYRADAAYGFSREFVDYIKGIPIEAKRGSASGRALLEGRMVHIADVTADPEYTLVEAQRLGDYRTILCVPMLREGVPIGVLALTRSEVRPFTDKQIELAATFADQAAIAIENARLLKELREQSQEVAKLNQQLERRVADQVGEIERMSRLRRFLPPQVADLIVASGAEKQLESHRREITALFCDLRGFTGFSESSDPEDVMSLLRAVPRGDWRDHHQI